VNRPYRPTRTRHAAWALDGRLLALVADGEPDPLAFLDVPEGQPALTSEQIAEHIATLDADQLAALIEAARSEAEAIDPSTVTSEDVDRINLLGDAVDAATARQEAIAAEETERQENAQRALDRLRRPAEDGENGDGEDGDGEGGTDGADGEHEGADGEQVPEPVAASAPRRLGSRRPGSLPRPGAAGGMGSGTGNPANRAPSGFTAPRATTALVAAAGLESLGLNPGSPIGDRRQLGEAFGLRLDAIRRVRGSGADGEQVPVASVRTTFPEDRVLRSNAVDSNTTNVRTATDRETIVAAGEHYRQQGALVAAGGLCAPIEQLYDVPVIGSSARPVRDALANFGADRGGVSWREALSFGDFAGAVGFWTIANDEAQGDANAGNNPAPKPCLAVECPDLAEAYVEAITLCLLFSNVSARFDPEGTAANIAAAQVAHARVAENRLMGQIAALSTTVTGGEVVGTTRDLLTFLDQLLAQYRSFYRLDDAIALRCVLPAWVEYAILSDLTRSFSDEMPYAVASQTIASWFARRGVNVSYHLDGRPATTAAAGTEVAMAAQAYGAFTHAGAVAAFPGQIEALLWVEGDMLHLDGGTLDLGVVRDSQLAGTNQYKTFSESWEGVAHRGVEAIRGVVTTRPLGMVAGTTDTTAILAA
jgi:hypothetical protein